MSYNEYLLHPDPREIILLPETQDLYLQVFVGNGQSGGSLLVLNGSDVPAGDLTNKFYIASRDAAADTSLQIITNVLDINWQTDNCVITTKFNG